MEIEVGDGTKRQLGAGSILLAEDTEGQGHISRSINGEPRECLFIPCLIKEENMGLEVHQFGCLSDNYGFLIHDPESGETAS